MDTLHAFDGHKLSCVLFFAIINRDSINIFMCKGVLKHNPIGVTISLKLKEENHFSFCLPLRTHQGEKQQFQIWKKNWYVIWCYINRADGKSDV